MAVYSIAPFGPSQGRTCVLSSEPTDTEPLLRPMEPRILEAYLRRHIPLSSAMDLRVIRSDEDGVILRAPLEPNINHHESVFGGSASALAILSAWSLVHLRLREHEQKRSRIFIQKMSQSFDLPIPGEVTARSFLTDPDRWPWFIRTLERRGRARIMVSAHLEHDGTVAGRFEGAFAALL